MQNKSQARVQIPSQPTPGQTFRIATVTGTPEACQVAQSMIERVIMDQSSQSVMSGIAFRGGTGATAAVAATGYYGQQQQPYGSTAASAYGQQSYAYGTQQQQQQPQKDYTAEWAAYYAAQAAAAAVGATTTAQTATTGDSSASTTAASVPTDPTAYYNDFWKYAEYYGEDAARLYYGAWSPPVGSINPNSSTPSNQPQGDVTTATNTSTMTGSAAKDTRDTSVRSVSNLPAWMTNQG